MWKKDIFIRTPTSYTHTDTHSTTASVGLKGGLNAKGHVNVN